MLEQFIESKSNKNESKNRRNLLFSTFSLLTLMCCSALLWSLFARSLDLGSGNLEIAEMVAPVSLAENEVVKEVVKTNEVKNTSSSKPQEITRKVDMLRVEDNTEAPKTISTVQNTEMSRPLSGKARISNIDFGNDVNNDGLTGNERNNGGNNTGKKIGNEISSTKKIDETDDIPVLEKKVKIEKVDKKPLTKSLGVLNGKATYLPKPNLTAAAKAVGASGTVTVQISIDENGNVTSANAISGHPLLKADCERVARMTKFSQTLLSNQAVKATGILTYNFVR